MLHYFSKLCHHRYNYLIFKTSISAIYLQTVKTLGVFKKLTKLDKGLGPRLPEAYKKFYKEWKLTEPTAVHYIPEEGTWKRNEVTGEV